MHRLHLGLPLLRLDLGFSPRAAYLVGRGADVQGVDHGAQDSSGGSPDRAFPLTCSVLIQLGEMLIESRVVTYRLSRKLKIRLDGSRLVQGRSEETFLEVRWLFPRLPLPPLTLLLIQATALSFAPTSSSSSPNSSSTDTTPPSMASSSTRSTLR
jgi:hypothetical protein